VERWDHKERLDRAVRHRMVVEYRDMEIVGAWVDRKHRSSVVGMGNVIHCHEMHHTVVAARIDSLLVEEVILDMIDPVWDMVLVRIDVAVVVDVERMDRELDNLHIVDCVGLGLGKEVAVRTGLVRIAAAAGKGVAADHPHNNLANS